MRRRWRAAFSVAGTFQDIGAQSFILHRVSGMGRLEKRTRTGSIPLRHTDGRDADLLASGKKVGIGSLHAMPRANCPIVQGAIPPTCAELQERTAGAGVNFPWLTQQRSLNLQWSKHHGSRKNVGKIR